MSVYLLNRKGRRGKNSLFLVHYNNGKRYHEFLKLYVYDTPKDAIEREHNRQVMKLAKQIQAQKLLDQQFTEHNAVSPVKEKIGILKYMERVMKQKEGVAGWSSAFLHLRNYLKGGDISLSLIDSIWLSNYQKYLLTAPISRGGRRLGRNSAACYYTKLSVVLKQAYMERFIKENPCTKVKTIKPFETHRNYLTVEEIKLLKETECEFEELKVAFLFCCYTGLRFSDVQALHRQQFSFSEATGWQLTYTQKKTKGAEVLPVAAEAMQLLTNFSVKEGKIFPNLLYSAWTNIKLKNWFDKAGITRHLTFHSSRHTFATTLLAKGVNLSVVSSLLGHKSMKTSTIYAKVIDQSKIEAINKMSILN